jgi:hypothetical protein
MNPGRVATCDLHLRYFSSPMTSAVTPLFRLHHRLPSQFRVRSSELAIQVRFPLICACPSSFVASPSDVGSYMPPNFSSLSSCEDGLPSPNRHPQIIFLPPYILGQASWSKSHSFIIQMEWADSCFCNCTSIVPCTRCIRQDFHFVNEFSVD